MIIYFRFNLDNTDIIGILTRIKIIAIVGLSRNSEKDSNRVAKYLQFNGYRIIPINPLADKILGEKCYNTLLDIPESLTPLIDVVDIFRPSTEVPEIVKQSILLKKSFGKPNIIWMQLGIINDTAAKEARNAGIKVIMNRCIMIEHKKLFHKEY
jgi:predicted CoA-binding protein